MQTLARPIYPVCNSNPVYAFTPITDAFKQNRESCCDTRNETLHFKGWMETIRDILPGGSWWNLNDFDQNTNGSPAAAKPMTVLEALSQIWALVADEKWILYTAFGALTVAAVNRLRETVYKSLLLQDMSFYDTEAVGDLTSRINSDCQRLSRTIGNDIHLILRNILQGTGAFIHLMTLSWPLALSSLVVCITCLQHSLFMGGKYQKKAAQLAQDFVASANEVAQETLSLIRTVRAYGTEREEFQRFKQWLDRLAFVGMRESVAFGFWTLSFSTFYRSTQVLAVLLGGMSILSGRVSAEQLTKYVLYCEWLIYAAWRLQDSMSSLLQSLGACEKVFQLMHLPPSSEFL
ncbi:UNVERIFIED_CONTAM: ABC transporter B family member 26, chloroplastic [Sesamum calycinum]|uniref:ABC transporter B family member 26, chloroplastic n=1 Tax=Sesamum calycinum TaxID=2727403 RepID=A0AAW2MMP2_9LAMI